MSVTQKYAEACLTRVFLPRRGNSSGRPLLPLGFHLSTYLYTSNESLYIREGSSPLDFPKSHAHMLLYHMWTARLIYSVLFMITEDVDNSI